MVTTARIAAAHRSFNRIRQVECVEGSCKVTGYSSLQHASPLQELTRHYGITWCYLQPDRGDIPAFTQPMNAGTRFSDPEGCKAELS